MPFFKILEKKIFNISKYILFKIHKEYDYKPKKYLIFSDVSQIQNHSFPENSYFESLRFQRDNYKSSKDDDLILKSFENYQGYVGFRMNNFLRVKEIYLDESSLLNYINTISNTIDKYSLQSNIVVSRIMDSKSFEIFTTHFKLLERGFLSTSLILNNDKNYDDLSIENKVFFFLKVPMNSNAIYLGKSLPEDKQQKEFELLIQKGSRINIERKFKIFSYRIIFGIIEQQ